MIEGQSSALRQAMHRAGARFIILALTALPTGCRTERADYREPHDTMTVLRSDSLRFELFAPAEARAGEPVAITLRLTNTSDRPLELHLRGRDVAFDITVAREDGVTVWRRLEGQTVLGILQIRVMTPGERLDLSDVWRQRDRTGRPVDTGTYTLQGVLPTDEPEPLRTPVARLRVTSP